ncbi:methyltransferase [Candidatus Acidianus copahuensis]|uniref:Methyltransferase n=1 Tax=Candidatus Acidianus copahuensis TaxID=1160895 RepID=A0A031LMA5_9CREN|nr:HemK2/MTQ2 family protein methyltransferase [Candidatus Acidianus copahuensis]EZQ03887.1 methyltransferase [Candidatus Acidianus copahuensis]
MEGQRIIEFNRIKICINNETYEPSDDTSLLMSIIDIKKGDKVIEIGSGSGILSLEAFKMGGEVVAIDINPFAAISTLCTSRINSAWIEVINCEMLTCIRDVKFDVAIFNPPYLPYEERKEWIEYSWSGGPTGSEELIRFFDHVKAKRIYTLYSSLTDYERVLSYAEKKGLTIRKKVEKNIGLETIFAVEFHDKSSSS